MNTYMWNLKKKQTSIDDLISEAEIDTQAQRAKG